MVNAECGYEGEKTRKRGNTETPKRRNAEMPKCRNEGVGQESVAGLEAAVAGAAFLFLLQERFVGFDVGGTGECE